MKRPGAVARLTVGTILCTSLALADYGLGHFMGAAIPEPVSILVLGTALLGCAAIARRHAA